MYTGYIFCVQLLVKSIYMYFLFDFSKYYEKDALVADPEYGSILSSLLGKLTIGLLGTLCTL